MGEHFTFRLDSGRLSHKGLCEHENNTHIVCYDNFEREIWKQTDTETNRLTQRQTETEIDRHSDIQTQRLTDTETDRHRDRQTQIQTDRQAKRENGREIYR